MEDEHARIINKTLYLEFSSEEEGEREEEEEEEEEEDETLSLSNLPLNHNVTNKYNSFDDVSSRQSRRSSLSEATDFFEFFSDFSSDMCPADDIIFCGKLVPFKDKDQPFFLSEVTDQTQKKPIKSEATTKPPTHRRRSESLSKLQSSVTRSNSTNVCSNSRRFMMRNSRSLDYRRLHRSSSSLILPAPEIERNPSARSEIVVKKAMKPRWYSLMFGIVKVPTAMELNDIKNRQFRRNPSTTMFPTTDSGGKLAVNQNSGKVSWKILKALSCKDHTSVSVTTPFVVPQASYS